MKNILTHISRSVNVTDIRRILIVLMLLSSMQPALGQAVIVKDFNPSGSERIELGIELNGKLLFTADEGSNVYSLWISDGTQEGTARLLMTANNYSYRARTFVSANGLAYFIAGSSAYGIELWRTDGTAEGTFMLKDINPGIASSVTELNNQSMNGKFYFRAFDPAYGYEVWVTDGTMAGTQLFADTNPGTASGNPSQFTVWNNQLYFTAQSPALGADLWTTDGISTPRCLDIIPGSAWSAINNLTAFADGLYYYGHSDATGYELFKTDGTLEGTSLVADINPGTASSYPNKLIVSGSRLYFIADVPQYGQELWSTDGTASGTNLVRDIYWGSGSSFIDNLIDNNGTLYFTASNNGATYSYQRYYCCGFACSSTCSEWVQSTAPTNIELWKTSGSSAQVAADLRTIGYSVLVGPSSSITSYSSAPRNLTSKNGLLFFAAYNNTNTTALYGIKDQSTAKSFTSPLTGINTEDLMVAGNKVFLGTYYDGLAVLHTDGDQDNADLFVDCNDHDATIYPGAYEVPENNVDENCDGKLGQTVAVSWSDRSPIYGGRLSFELTRSHTGGDVLISTTDENVATIQNNMIIMHNAGTFSLRVELSATPTLDALVFESEPVTISKAPLFAIAEDKSAVYGDALPNLSVRYEGFVGQDNSSMIDTPPSLYYTAGESTSPLEATVQERSSIENEGATLKEPSTVETKVELKVVDPKNAGQYTIAVSGGADNSYEFFPQPGVLTIQKAPLTIHSDDKSITYGDDHLLEFTMSYEGFKGSDDASVLDNPPVVSPLSPPIETGTHFLNAGSYTLAFGTGASTPSDNNYEFTLVPGTLLVIKATLTATADDQSMILGDPMPSFSISYLGFKGSAEPCAGCMSNLDDISSIDLLPVTHTVANAESPASTYPITVAGGADNNYAFEYIEGTLTVTGTPPRISITDPSDGAESVIIDVVVAAKAQSGATNYTIQLSTVPDFTSGIIQQSSSTPEILFTGLSYGTTYYARAKTDLVNVYGEITSFTTTRLSYVISPADDALNVSTSPSLKVLPTGARSYVLQLSTANDFSAGLMEFTGKKIEFAVDGLSLETRYYARVSTDLTPGIWGETRSFRTGNITSMAYLIDPADGATGVPTRTKVTANEVPGASTYTLELNTNPDFTGLSILESAGKGTFNVRDLLSGTLYFARVRTDLSIGYGPVTSFTTADESAARRVVSPIGSDEGAGAVTVSPNPFRTSFRLTIAGSQDAIHEYTLFDLSGRELSTGTIQNNATLALGESLSTGVYILKLRSMNMTIRTIRLIKL